MKRKPNPLAPKIPAHFGPHRRAALEEAQDGWCAVCSQVIPLRTDGKRRASTRAARLRARATGAGRCASWTTAPPRRNGGPHERLWPNRLDGTARAMSEKDGRWGLALFFLLFLAAGWLIALCAPLHLEMAQ
jgi:hypothetical protein